MKKVTAVLIVAFILGLAMPAQAQIKLGVKGGLNLASSLSSTWENRANADSYTGFHIGPMLDIKIPIVGLGVDGALMYSQKGNKIGDTTMKQRGIEVPVNLKYGFGLGDFLGIYFAAGPSFFYNFNKEDEFTINSNTRAAGTMTYKKSELAFNIGAGVKILNHLQVGVNYNMPLTDSATAHINENFNGNDLYNLFNGKSIKTKVWQVSVAYLF